MVLKNNTDFTIKPVNNYDAVKTFCDLFFVSLPFTDITFKSSSHITIASFEDPPPKVQNTLVISTSVLRI